MKLKDLFEATTGPVKWSVSDSEEPLYGSCFYAKYSMSQEWEKEVVNVSLIPKSKSYAIFLVKLEYE